jgi:iron complex transport system permease protein
VSSTPTLSRPDTNPQRARRAPRSRTTTFLIAAMVVLLITMVAASGVGAFTIPPNEVLGGILSRMGIGALPAPDATGLAVLWEIRIPRVLLAVLVGAALGTAGALMQGVFRNPLAEPGIVGVSSGAAVGAVLAIVLGLTAFGPAVLVGAAFLFGLGTTLVVYALSRHDGRAEVVTLVLTGIAVNAFAGAVIGLMTFFSTDDQLRAITFWSLGSLATATWTSVLIAAPCTIAGVLVAPRFARRLDLLAAGESSAGHLGVDVERTRVVVVVVVALLTAGAVAVAGILTFVGLVVPHLVRMILGPAHRGVILGSAALGALGLLIADLIARTIAAPAEVPLGVLTALVGSPMFFYLLRRTRARQGGWA